MAEVRTALVVQPDAGLEEAGRTALETIAALAERGWRVVVVVPEDGPLVDAAQQLGAETEVLATPVFRRTLLQIPGLAGLASALPAASRRIDALLRRVQPDAVVVSGLTLPLWIARTRGQRVPVVVHVRGIARTAPLPLREMLALPLRLADRVVVNSEALRAGLIELAPTIAQRSVVLIDGVAGPPEPTPPRAELTGPLRLVFPGAVAPGTGVDVAVEAVALLALAGVDARLDLPGGVPVGDEAYADELRATADRLGVAERVRIPGFRPSAWAALAQADIALVPSRDDEPSGTAAVEAVLAGRPVAFSATGGQAEAFDGFASAVPVPPDDPAALVAAVVRIAELWPVFRRTARALAPIAAQRYAPARYRAGIVREIEATVRLPHLS